MAGLRGQKRKVSDEKTKSTVEVEPEQRVTAKPRRGPAPRKSKESTTKEKSEDMPKATKEVTKKVTEKKTAATTKRAAGAKPSAAPAPKKAETTRTAPVPKKAETTRTVTVPKKTETTRTVTVPKKAETTRTATESSRPAKRARKTSINELKSRPTEVMSVFCFGTGDMGELGLGPEANARVVKRPRLNPFLLPDEVEVVQIAVGGMHALALTKDGKVYSWGINDQGALGRDTHEPPKEKVEKAGDESDDEEDRINAKESTPAIVEGVPEDIEIVQVAAGDSISAALTSTGDVWGWGTFRCSDGILGFNEKLRVATRPVKLDTLRDIVDLCAGTDHMLALDKYGIVYAWGNGQQHQLGRRVVERTRLHGLTPRELAIRKIKKIGVGSYHSFAIDESGKVYSWGVNQYSQCGLYDEIDSLTGSSIIPTPTRVPELEKYEIAQITGGEHHSAAVTLDGSLLVWGRNDASELGLDKQKVNPDVFIKDVNGRERFVAVPTAMPDFKVSWIGCGTHHNLAINKEDGAVYSWGYAEAYQVGLGPGEEDIDVPTKIVNTATKDFKILWTGGGGQFSVIAGVPRPSSEDANGSGPMINGANGAS